MSDLATLQEEVTLNRNRYHTLSNELGIIKARLELLGTQNHVCLKEKDWGQLLEVLKTHSAHVVAGDTPTTGYRDRLLLAEVAISEMRRKIWQTSIMCGILGALIGSGAKDAIILVVNWIIGK